MTDRKIQKFPRCGTAPQCGIKTKNSLLKSFFYRFRTAINVLGDSIGAGLVYHLSKKELEEVSNKKMEGGFEALPMTEIEDNDERNK